VTRWLLIQLSKTGLILHPDTKAHLWEVRHSCRECLHHAPGHYSWCVGRQR
jgi:hypothetical protein